MAVIKRKIIFSNNQVIVHSLILLNFFPGKIPGNYVNVNYSLPLSATTNRLKLLSNGSLMIMNCKETDMGYYLCRASNRIGYPLSKVAHLTVHSK